MNGLDIFSGVGGISLALKEWVRPIAYCEIDPYCQGVLFSRMADESLSYAPIWDDITTLSGLYFDGSIDIIYGGFPCQDISIAGLGKGLDGKRSGLFFEVIRLLREARPGFLFLENVPAITTRGGVEVTKEITSLGYDCRWCVISAEKFIDQKRDRWFCLAKSNGKRFSQGASEILQSPRKSIINEEFSNYKLSTMECWKTFAESVREDNGLPFRLDRIKAMGNSVCSEQAKEAFKILMGLSI